MSSGSGQSNMLGIMLGRRRIFGGNPSLQHRVKKWYKWENYYRKDPMLN